jgi:hypothetical protein
MEGIALDGVGLDFVQESSPGRWRVIVIRAGRSTNGNTYSPELLQESAGAFEGRPLQVYEMREGRYSHLPARIVMLLKGGLVKSTVGLLRDVQWDATEQALVAEAVITSDWLAGFLSRASESIGGPVKTFGLSINAAIEGVRDAAGLTIKRFLAVDSVDVVTSPAAGGEFTRALEALASEYEEQDSMDEKQIRAMIQEALSGFVTEEKIEALVKAMAGQGDTRVTEEIAGLRAEMAAERHAMRCERIVTPLMAKAPEKVRDLVVKTVVAESKHDATDEVLRALAKTYADSFAPASTDVPVRGTGRIRVTAEPEDKQRSALYALVGVQESADAEGVVPFRGIQEAYKVMTGDVDLVGRVAEGQDSTTFPIAMGEALHRRLRAEYRAIDFGEERLISTHERVNDFKTHKLVVVGGFGDIPAVLEGGAYQPLTMPAEESADLKVSKRGATIDVTWESIINDDLSVTSRHARKLGRSARRTFAKGVWALLSGNPTVYDTKALFHADHGNLGAAAFSVTSLIAARAAMKAQKELTSLEPLGIDPKEGGLLVIPTDLEQTAFELLKTDKKPGSPNNDGNFVYGWFGKDLERVLVNPFATDVTDWQVLANPQVWETIVAGHLFGQQEPEVITADQAIAFSMWNNDKIEYKIRHIWGLSIADYRPVYGAVVAG